MNVLDVKVVVLRRGMWVLFDRVSKFSVEWVVRWFCMVDLLRKGRLGRIVEGLNGMFCVLDLVRNVVG